MHTSLIFVLLVLFTQESPRYEVRLKPEAGKPFVSRLTIESKTTMEFLDPDDTSKKETRRLMAFRLVGLTPDKSGNRSIKVTFSRFLISDGSESFDTDQPKETDSSKKKYFRHLIGLSAILKVKPNGTISDVSGLDEMEKEFVKRSSVSEEKNKGFKKGIRALLLPQILQALSFSAPKPVSIGESWSRSMPVPYLTTPYHAENRWTLKKASDQKLILDLASKLTPHKRTAEEAARLKKDGGGFVTKLTGTQEGRLELDRKTGWPLRINLKLKLEGTTAIGYMGRVETENTAQLKMSCSITLEPVGD